MTPRPVPEALLPWASQVLGFAQVPSPSSLVMIAGDASNRRYFRLTLGASHYVLAEAPPSTEKNEAFAAVRDILAAAGVRVPALFGIDLQRGFLCLEDLGDDTLLPALDSRSVDRYYGNAFDLLRCMAKVNVHETGLGQYDRPLLCEELSRFPRWFAQELLEYSLNRSELELFDRLSGTLIDSALQQPQVLVHRDFHSRNLMLCKNDPLAVIDFQDAVIGPITYDLVSLLRDCYVQWPVEQVHHWALSYRDALVAHGLLGSIEDHLFLQWFDWMGLQRHLKVLGTFARLFLRDGKSAYLADLPLVLVYVEEILDRYADVEPVFAEFRGWFAQHLSPLIAARPWSAKP